MQENTLQMIGRIQYLINVLKRDHALVAKRSGVKKAHVDAAVTALENGRDLLLDSMDKHQQCLLNTAQLFSVQLGFFSGHMAPTSKGKRKSKLSPEGQPSPGADAIAAWVGMADPLTTMSPGWPNPASVTSSYSISGGG